MIIISYVLVLIGNLSISDQTLFSLFTTSLVSCFYFVHMHTFSPLVLGLSLLNIQDLCYVEWSVINLVNS